jgi:hypothetical protein
MGSLPGSARRGDGAISGHGVRAMSRVRPRARIVALAILACALVGSAVTVHAATMSAGTGSAGAGARETGSGAPAEGSAGSRRRWAPRPGSTWQWQLSGPLDTSVSAQVYDIDLFDTSAAQVRRRHALGRKVICYLSAGSYEPDRPDSGKYPRALLGRPLAGWPDERWLDIRRLDLLDPLIAARMEVCAAKGFDGVEPDNVDGYVNDTGFLLTAAEQRRFNTRVAQLAHRRELAVGLKNDLGQVSELRASFDFAVNEQCVQYNECASLSPFIRAGKAVFHVEYNLPLARFCPVTRPLGFSSMKKPLNLGAARWPCPT